MVPGNDRAHPTALVSSDALRNGVHFPASAEREDVVDLLHGIRVIARHNPQVVVARNEEDIRKPDVSSDPYKS